VDLAAHGALERLVDETLPLHGRLALESNRHDHCPEMAAAFTRTRVAAMQMALVDHFDVNGSEPLAQ